MGAFEQRAEKEEDEDAADDACWKVDGENDPPVDVKYGSANNGSVGR